jgi:hypothetical protein
LRRLFPILSATALLLLGAAGAEASVGSGERRAALSPLEAANTLLSTPWKPFGKQLETDTEHTLEGYEGKKLAGGGGGIGITYKGVGVTAKWSFGIKAQNVKAGVDLSAPPGLTASSPSEIAFAAPRNGGWSFGLQGILHPYAWVKVAGVKIWKNEDVYAPFAIGIKDFRLAARAELNSSEPDRPRLVKATITPQLKLGGAGVFPGVIPVTFSTTVEQGKVTMRGTSISLPLADFGFADAHFNGDITVVLEPSGIVQDIDNELIKTRTEYMGISVKLKGKVTLGIKYVPSSKESFAFEILSFKGFVPSFDQLNDFLRLTKQPTPRSWGEESVLDSKGQVLGRALAPQPGVDYAAPAAAIEAGIPAHMPYGAVLSIDCGTLEALKKPPCKDPSWAGDEDSAIWTGHYLAAESFRYAAGDQAALAKVQAALAGIERLFWVTGDTAVAGGKRVSVGAPTGMLARTAAPLLARGSDQPDYPKPLGQRKCYYERPEGGWSAGKGTYPTLAKVPASLRDSATRVGRIWRGWGCGDDMPVSKDQYSGVFYGLAMAHTLVPAVQLRVKKLVNDALDYFVKNGWNVRLPPNERIETTFLGDFPKQLAFLRLGATVDRAKWEQKYLDVAPAAAHAWIPIWFSAADPVLQYYKFNLSHSALATALVLETDPTIRAGYTYAHSIMWRAVRHHRNAYFSLLRLLMQPPASRQSLAAAKPSGSNPDLTVSQEIQSVLGDWIARYGATKTSLGMPTGAVADPAAQISLYPDKIGEFVGFDGTVRKLSRYALPITARNGRDKDFVWQRDPFDTSYRGGKQGCRREPPTPTEVASCGGRPQRIHPGVDYLLAYWLARYLSILPAPAGAG